VFEMPPPSYVPNLKNNLFMTYRNLFMNYKNLRFQKWGERGEREREKTKSDTSL
jgi:hypothetical protein